jgi:hypothetical protein
LSVNIKSCNVVFVKNSIKKMNSNYIIWNVKNQLNVKFVMKTLKINNTYHAFTYFMLIAFKNGFYKNENVQFAG